MSTYDKNELKIGDAIHLQASGTLHDCLENLKPIDHSENAKDWYYSGGSAQSYQVYRCATCGDYWGIRHQYDAGTGRDDRPHRFGPDIATVKRHY